MIITKWRAGLPLNKTGFSSWMFLVWQTWLCQGWFSHSVTWEFVVACSVKVWKEGEMACNLAPEWWGPKWMMKMARIQYPIWVAIVIYSVICNKVSQKINLCILYVFGYVRVFSAMKLVEQRLFYCILESICTLKTQLLRRLFQLQPPLLLK